MIIKNHGKGTETYKTARNYLKGYSVALRQWIKEGKEEYGSIEKWSWDNHYEDFESVYQDDNDSFLYSLCEDYRIILQHEFEYLTSEKSIVETIKANNYGFFENGD